MSCELVQVNGGGSWGIFFRGTGASGNQCQEEPYETSDGLIMGARSALLVSMCAGFIAGLMVAFEFLFSEVCCAGLLEGLAFFLAWSAGGAAFMFYGTDLCVQDGKVECEYTDASGYLTAAVVFYLLCAFLLCCTPQPDPLCKRN